MLGVSSVILWGIARSGVCFERVEGGGGCGKVK